MSWRTVFWGLCVPGALIATAFVAVRMVVGGDRGMLPIGETTDAHHQIEMACETCHAAPAFAGAAAAVKAMNKTCRNCHEDELRAAGDSHPGKLFRSPGMAVYRERIDARLCTACHVEHRPEITRARSPWRRISVWRATPRASRTYGRSGRAMRISPSTPAPRRAATTITTTVRCTKISWSSTPAGPGSRRSRCTRGPRVTAPGNCPKGRR